MGVINTVGVGVSDAMPAEQHTDDTAASDTPTTGEEDPRVGDDEGVSRRDALRRGVGVVAGGSVLPALAGRASATPHGGSNQPLDVRTTDVEVLEQSGTETAEQNGTRTTGTIDGMDEVDCERCRVGAQVSRPGHDRWYGGVHDVVTAKVSVRVAVTLVGLRPGKYQCRLVACPITHDHLCFGNPITVIVKGGHGKRKHHEKRNGKREKKRDDCPCGHDHPGMQHLTLCGVDWTMVHDYAFMVSGERVAPFTLSSAPSAVDHEFVTANRTDAVHGDIVSGSVAGGADSFLFPGEVTDFRCDDGVRVYLDGQRVGF